MGWFGGSKDLGEKTKDIQVFYDWDGRYWVTRYSLVQEWKFDTKKPAVKKAKEAAKKAVKNKDFDAVIVKIQKKSGEMQRETRYD